MSDRQQESMAAAHLRRRVQDLDLAESSEAYPHAGLVGDGRRMQVLNLLAMAYDGDISETQAYRDLVQPAGTETVGDAVEHGNVSQMQYVVGMVNHDKSAADRSTQAWITEEILSEAYIGWVTGGPGSGKTAWAGSLADRWLLTTRGTVFSNVESMADRNAGFEYVDGYEALQDGLDGADGPVGVLLDETDQTLRGGSDDAYVDALAATIKLIRKCDAPEGTERLFLLVGQTDIGVGRDLRRLVDSNGHRWHKPEQKTVEVYGSDVVAGEVSRMTPDKTIQGVRDTRLEFDTTEDADFDMSAALDDASEEDSTLSPKQQDIRTAIRAVALQDLAYRDAASLTDYAKDWVGDRVREWHQGEHRDLAGVDPPDDGSDGEPSGDGTSGDDSDDEGFDADPMPT